MPEGVTWLYRLRLLEFAMELSCSDREQQMCDTIKLLILPIKTINNIIKYNKNNRLKGLSSNWTNISEMEDMLQKIAS